jgi:uncharacterized protein (DUF885 family)
LSEFAARVDAFLDATFALDPVFATAMGNHARDGAWPDLSEAGRTVRLRHVDEWTTAFARFDDAKLTADERIDRDLLLGELAAQRFGATVVREEAWSPMWWVYVIGEGFFGLLAREFAPLSDRLASIASRAEGLPRVVDAARAALVGVDGRPVDRLHTEKALEQWPGLISIVDEAIRAGEAAVDAGDAGVAAVLPRLRAAREVAAAALDETERHLREIVIPAAQGEGRLGPDLFAAKLAVTMRDPTVTPERIRERAEREFDSVRAEMVRIARDIAPDWLGGAPPPDDDDDVAVVRAVWDAIAVEHPERDQLLDFCRAEVGRIEAFCREHELVRLADEPLEITWTPEFLRTFAGAMLSSPGPLEAGLKAMFFITPIDEDASPEQVESHLREDNARMLQVLTIHEAVPGHYLQGVYANRGASRIRAIFGDGVYQEGWALYMTQGMMDAGYSATDPALLLCHWKYYLRCVINALIDVGIHATGMSEAAAIELMVDGGFQEEAAARSKYDRARLTSTQLSTYFVGSMAFWDLEDEARRRAAVAAGAAADSVPVPRVVGDYGETPGFDHRGHLEACLSHGAPPMPLLRRLLLD